MLLKPVSFSIPSTTELKITFNNDLSLALNVANFEVISLGGSSSNLNILSVDINLNIIILRVSPQKAGNYYSINLLDSQLSLFESAKGIPLIQSKNSRSLFFVGINTSNPSRDRALRLIPSIVEVENTVVRSIIEAHTDEIMSAERAVGEVLSDNYIRETVVDEYRVRSGGPTDRLANENAFNIIKVSKSLSTDNLKLGTLNYNDNNANEKLRSIPNFPISLKQSSVITETLTIGNGFNKFRLFLSNPSVIRVLSVKLIKTTDVIDCNGNIGTSYNIDKYKYSILNNIFDPDSAFSFAGLQNNEVLLSRAGNISEPANGDTIEISYLYNIEGISPVLTGLSVSAPISVSNELIPSGSSTFTLSNAPIVDQNNIITSIGGVIFLSFENDASVNDVFKTEIAYNSDRPPNRFGEYSVNYNTGDVFVFGATSSALGTDDRSFFASYSYRRTYIKDIDYATNGSILAAISGRGLSGSKVQISYPYEQVLVDGVDYVSSSHIEVSAERVGGSLSSSFSLNTKNSDITDVFRVFNQTTGEDYTPVFVGDSEVFFTGNNLPVISNRKGESSNFSRVTREKLVVVAEFIAPTHFAGIISNTSNNNIIFSPGIPSELISASSSNYFIRSTDSASDIRILFFGTADGNGLINDCAIDIAAITPILGSNVTIGIRTFVANLSKQGVLNFGRKSYGNFGDSSVLDLNSSLFLRERYFQPAVQGINPNFDPVVELSSALSPISYRNLSRVRRPGDYLIDYKHGVVYLGVLPSSSYEIGDVSYTHGEHIAVGNNIFNVEATYKSLLTNVQDPGSRLEITGSSALGGNILSGNIGDSLLFLDGDNVKQNRLTGTESLMCIVDNNYIVTVENEIGSINYVCALSSLVGSGLSSTAISDRIEDSTSQQITVVTRDGGNNLFDYKFNSHTKNRIDLKASTRTVASLNPDLSLSLRINDPEYSAIHSVVKVRTGEILFSADLNIQKLSGLIATSTITGAGFETISIDQTTGITGVDTLFDYFVDSNGNRFAIQAFDLIANTITVTTPAINNNTVNAPSVGISSVVIKPIINVTTPIVDIIIPSDAGIASNESLIVYYLKTTTPIIGSEVAVDYDYGDVKFDYTNVDDDIVIWYEYGDNSIDWSTGASVLEGDAYYVTYEYGALRRNLERNFGLLTGVPSLRVLPMDMDRELYRNGIQSVMQSYPRGPTEESFQNMGRIFTGITPSIKYSTENSWILGRDSLSYNRIKTNGNLVFGGGRNSGGLFLDENIGMKISSDSSLPVDQGTISMWVRPEWNGIDNDADLSFGIKSMKNYSFSLGSSSRRSLDYLNWKIPNTLTYNSLVSDKSTQPSLYNYKLDSTSAFGVSQDVSGLSRVIPNFNESSKLTFSSSFLIESIGLFVGGLSNIDPLLIASSQGSYSVGTLCAFNGDKNIGFRVSLSSEAVVTSGTYTNLNTPLSYSDLQNINSLESTVTFQADIDLSVMFATKDTRDITPQCFFIKDANGDFYDVIASISQTGLAVISKTIMPQIISGLVVSRFPSNMNTKSGLKLADFDAISLTGDLVIYSKQISRTLLASANASSTAYGTIRTMIVDWSSEVKVSLNLDTLGNNVKSYINGHYNEEFYSDFEPYAGSPIDVELSPPANGFIVMSENPQLLIGFRLLDLSGEMLPRLGVSDIYIGANGDNPRLETFVTSKIKGGMGFPVNSDVSEGLFIGFDENARSIVTGEIGQWRLRSRTKKELQIPASVFFTSPTVWSTVTSPKYINSNISGEISTNGVFSSVLNVNGAYPDNTNKKIVSYSFDGNNSLDTVGWFKTGFVDTNQTQKSLLSSSKWIKNGIFSASSALGVYNMGPSFPDAICSQSLLNGNYLYSNSIIPDGDATIFVTMAVTAISPTIELGTTGTFIVPFAGSFSGISPISLYRKDIFIKIELAKSVAGQFYIMIIDGFTNTIIGSVLAGWNDLLSHSYGVSITNQLIDITYDGVLVFSTNTTAFALPTLPQNIRDYSLKISLFDGDVADISVFHAENTPNSISIMSIDYNSLDLSVSLIDSDDIIIDTDDLISFSLNTNPATPSVTHDIDEFLFTSDTIKYIVDAKNPSSSERFSLLSDGAGFLSFRVTDRTGFKHNISTNIKNFTNGGLHHLACSWKIGSIDEKDEMHLFIDGQEVPNLHKFGGFTPISVNSKVSDISREFLQGTIGENIDYCMNYTSGTVSAGTDIFTSQTAIFSQEDIGRSILITNSAIASNLIGGEYIIISVISPTQVIFGSGTNLIPVIFSVSASDLTFSFPPTAGIVSNITTDVRNSKFIIFKEDSLGVLTEMSGIGYRVVSGIVSVISGSNAINPEFRVNLDTRVIEFVGKSKSSCLYDSTTTPADISVYIETFGLGLELVKERFNLSSSSYNNLSGLSSVTLSAAEPASIIDVKIRRILLNRMQITGATVIGSTASFSIPITTLDNQPSSTSVNIYRANTGRKLQVIFESDNADYSLFSQDITVAQDGTLSTLPLSITVFGVTTDGVNQETFFLSGDNTFIGSKFFKSVTHVSGNLNLIDITYPEFGVISISEVNTIDVPDNLGDYCVVSDYSNGIFSFNKGGLQSTIPFELISGTYSVTYPTFARIKAYDFGKDLFIGCSSTIDSGLKGIVEDFEINRDLSGDTRVTERFTSGLSSVTSKVNNPLPLCVTPSTTVLIPFADPFDLQIGLLSSLEFLDKSSNSVYTLSETQLEALSTLMNDELKFKSKMMGYGISQADYDLAFTKLKNVNGGVIKDISLTNNSGSYLETSSVSVNPVFGSSGVFRRNNLKVINSSGELREGEGAIEFWVNPDIDTKSDKNIRYYFDAYSSSEITITSSSSSVISLPFKISSILSIKLLLQDTTTNLQTGLQSGASGGSIDYNIGAILSPDGMSVTLNNHLPSYNSEVIISYISDGANPDRMSIFKTDNGYLAFSIVSNDIETVVTSIINWKKNSWHKVLCNYRTGSNGNDIMEIFVDGSEAGFVAAGGNIVQGTGVLAGGTISGYFNIRDGQVNNKGFSIKRLRHLGHITFGSNFIGSKSALSRMDNFRLSRKLRRIVTDSAGSRFDANFAVNLELVKPLNNDHTSTYFNDFNTTPQVKSGAIVVNSSRGIFDFELTIFDEMGKVIGANNGLAESIIRDVVKKIKPAHTNAFVIFKNDRC